MPELPEVETTRRGIEPASLNQSVTRVVIRQRSLRWPIPEGVEEEVTGITFKQITRQAKYLLLKSEKGTLIIHLGMTGTLRVLEGNPAAEKHDHVDLHLSNGMMLRFRDPRRFGAVLWTTEPIEQHPLIASLGIEPVGATTVDQISDHLYQKSRGRKVSIKAFIMDQKVITGVGNIYACESLFLSGIHPKRSCGSTSKQRYRQLAEAIQNRLNEAIRQGGTTLQDFRNSEGKPGYFQQQLSVYGREDEPCPQCDSPIKRITQNRRSSWYCPQCQH
ncbi:MAG: bifunctional DNA-formamidopyrimidine glycosylase/DNA-(apurinic or apyrimidinic site) lyase [Gammaproteobacteria bacterium]|jgi:formamidopyrimidine-DNA glycosylase|nr:bifunctional DNA-formamidopyrimidine glycosylase/DNA-(apurinic or apyrimidinic site) lyase [Gammaproteobacteria bacterium]MBT3472423.1 bifunctional DNA-formamidopyrimidine glycosylase/DNA-(apurinic or apyrimidinic site) lyase [Gammaproteobacteria bacterium]MBT3967580.1 bifunctional DNA-formamidopyrimidine glycosylase/DNA-(apurinic or apyrimidinic site) lyase [Gammaproteobacteria bacterium]MBT4330008.1 bifunctional DNA-formamidopyrimidine glycosylase/DNA-(apurinic or apyrimidinic site) lyase [